MESAQHVIAAAPGAAGDAETREAYHVNSAVLALLRPPPPVTARAENVAAPLLQRNVAACLYLHEVAAAQRACKQWFAALRGAPTHGLFYCAAIDAAWRRKGAGSAGTPPPVAALYHTLGARRLLSVRIVATEFAYAPPLTPRPYDSDADGPTESEVGAACAKAQLLFAKWTQWTGANDAVVPVSQAAVAAQASGEDKGVEPPPPAARRTRGGWPVEECALPTVRDHASAVRALQVYCMCPATSTALSCPEVLFAILRMRTADAGPLTVDLAFRQVRHLEALASTDAVYSMAAPWATTAASFNDTYRNSEAALLPRVRVLAITDPPLHQLFHLHRRMPTVTDLQLLQRGPSREWVVARLGGQLPWIGLRSVTWCRPDCARCSPGFELRDAQQHAARLLELRAVVARSAAPGALVDARCLTCAGHATFVATEGRPVLRPPTPPTPVRRGAARCAACWGANASYTCRDAPYCAVARLFGAFRADARRPGAPTTRLQAFNRPSRVDVSFGRPLHRYCERFFAAPTLGADDGLPEPQWEIAVEMEVDRSTPFARAHAPFGVLTLAETVLEIAYAQFRCSARAAGSPYLPALLGACAKALADIDGAARMGLEMAVEWAPLPSAVTAGPASLAPTPSLPQLSATSLKAAAETAASTRTAAIFGRPSVEVVPTFLRPAATTRGDGIPVTATGNLSNETTRCMLHIFLRGSERVARTSQPVAELCSLVLHVFRTTAELAGHEF